MIVIIYRQALRALGIVFEIELSNLINSLRNMYEKS